MNFKIAKGYTIVAVKVAPHADLLSIEKVPICNFVVMRLYAHDLQKQVPEP